MKVGKWLSRWSAFAFVIGGALLAGIMAHAQGQPQQVPPQETPQQQTQQQPSIAVEVKVVNVLASVRDKKGALVSNLGKEDFAIDEDGRPQTITYFARDTDLPLTLGLLVDTSMSQRRVLSDERDASQAFLDDILRADRDKAFLIHFDREVELLQDLTSSREKLQHALNEMDAPQFARPNQQPNQSPRQYPQGGGRGRGGGGFAGAGTTLYDAVYLASQDVIQKQQGRKALIVLSDGVDHGSKESLESAIETAQRADAIVYAIYFAGEQQTQNPFGGGGPFGRPGGGMGRRGGGGGRFPQQERVDGKKILTRMSKETGGNLFEVSKKQTIAQIYTSISEELRNQYSLGYTPAPDSSSGYHKIHLTTKQKDLTVQTREGYYGER
jgi:VWFA-related protein